MRNCGFNQLVRYKGQIYWLTRLGLGLNSALKIMATELKSTLRKMDRITSTTDSYVDDSLLR